MGHAEVVVFGNHDLSGVLTTGRALGVAADLERPKALLERVIGEQTSNERIAEIRATA